MKEVIDNNLMCKIFEEINSDKHKIYKKWKIE